ncbi:hypothetical protein TMatcc_001240 [Talaromyces marneffei ATCC 18224]
MAPVSPEIRLLSRPALALPGANCSCSEPWSASDSCRSVATEPPQPLLGFGNNNGGSMA